MGVVYAAYDPELDRRLAIKLLIDEAGGGTAARARLLREAQAMAKLSHPNVVAVHDVGTIQEQVWIAMEFVRGQTLTQWVKSTQPKWRDIVDVFCRAAEGLHAVHSAGLVHRDFKPDNVMFDGSGRVRVMDFGLARSAEWENSTAASRPGTNVRPKALENPLTEIGAIVGTPRYMAPEQWEQRKVDARTDQFSFCVALWEALFRQPPFEGQSLPELVTAVTEGKIQPPPKGTAVPGWLVGILHRGLSVDPARRFSSMQDLLGAIQRNLLQRRRWFSLGLLASAIITGVFWTSQNSRQQNFHCTLVEQGLAGVWDEARQQEVAAAFQATGLPFATAVLFQVANSLTEYSAAWTTQSRMVCEAQTRADSEAVTARALSHLCLEHRRSELRSLVDVFATANTTTVENATSAVERLRNPALCTDPRGLILELADAPQPDDRRLAAAVWSLRDRLSAVRFRELAGRYDEALQDITSLVTDARALGHPPALAEVLLEQAKLLGKKAEYDEADAVLMAAMAEAERTGYHALRAEALVYRIELVGFLQAKAESVSGWIEPTLSLVRHITPGSALEGRLLANIGLVRYRQGDFASAVQFGAQAVALFGRVFRDGDPELVRALLDLGRSYHRIGRADEALKVLERARESAFRILGPDHPILIGIYLNLANVGVEPGDLLYRRALELSERAFGPDHPSSASAIANLGNTYNIRGHFEQALALYVRAVDIYRRTIGEHPTTAFNLVNVAAAAQALGRNEQALAALRESLAIYEKSYTGGDHPDMLGALWMLGSLTHRLGRVDESRALFERGLAVARTAQNPIIQANDFALELAGTLLAAGDPRRAHEMLETIVGRFEDSPDFLARLQFLKARTLWLVEPAARPRARALAEVAERSYTALAGDDTALPPTLDERRTNLAEVRAWLLHHRVAGMAK